MKTSTQAKWFLPKILCSILLMSNTINRLSILNRKRLIRCVQSACTTIGLLCLSFIIINRKDKICVHLHHHKTCCILLKLSDSGQQYWRTKCQRSKTQVFFFKVQYFTPLKIMVTFSHVNND